MSTPDPGHDPSRRQALAASPRGPARPSSAGQQLTDRTPLTSLGKER